MSTNEPEPTSSNEPRSANAHERDPGRFVRAAEWLVALVAAGLLVVVGLPTGGSGVLVGALGGLGVLAAWYALAPPYAFAVGQLAFVAALGGRELEPIDWLAVGVLFLLLVVPELDWGRGRWRAALTLAFAVVLAGVAWAGQAAWEATWATAVVLAGTGTLIAYALHRYEHVQLGGPTSE